MAKERKASVIYEGNASQLVYAFPFDYLRKKFVKVEDIYTNITELTMGVDYTVEDKQVRLVKGIPLGHSVKIYRETTTDPLVEWQDASVLRSADLSLQEVQLLHLAEETSDKVFDSGMSTAYDNPNCWDGQYKRIINALDPIEDGDVVTLRYIKANQDSLLNQLKNTGAAQNASIMTTGDAQNARLTATGDNQNIRLNSTGDTQNKILTNTGDNYLDRMRTLKDTATTKATEANNSADLAKKWAVSDTSPDGVTGNKSSKTWAGEAKTYASNASTSARDAASSADSSASYLANTASNANAAKQSALSSANNASAASSSASNAATSASNAKISETNAANSAKAAAQSAIDAAKFDPSSYYSKAEVDNKIDNVWSEPIDWDTIESVSIMDGTSIVYDVSNMPARFRLQLLYDIFYPVGTVYMSADKTKTKADFPFMRYGTWEEVPANLCLQTGNASEAGTQRNAGLPNITGRRVASWGGGDYSGRGYTTGCFKQNTDTSYPTTTNGENWNGDGNGSGFAFDASLSNPIYGKSNTVQPPAYIVRAWIRTA